jgi:hypothetical protein
MTEAAAPSRKDQTRHHPKGKTCHHWQHHWLTCDEYDQLRARAAGACEICRTPEAETGGRRLVIDHFEDRQARLWFIRGLVCDRCNTVMSCFDGHKPWGANRRWEAAAREYEARSWQQPSPEQWAWLAASRQVH